MQIVDTLNPRSGGLAEAVMGLSRALRESGLSTRIMTDDRKEALGQFDLNAEDRAFICSTQAPSRVTDLFLRRIGLLLSRHTKPDLVHIHGLWAPLNHVACSEAKRSNIKLVIQPHGMLDDWAIGQKWFKKTVALYVYQRQDLTRADLLLATSEAEFRSIRNFGLRNPVAVVPNGFDMPFVRSTHFSRDPDRIKTALFLSRLHPKKGLEDLLMAWSLLRPRGWRLRVVGDGDPALLKRIQNLILKERLADQVFLEGGCYGEKRYRYYEVADLFILPSYGENFGIVILEALAHGVPVLTTDRTPWDELIATGSGWQVEPGVMPLLEALKIAVDLSDEQWNRMSRSALKLAGQYSWKSSAQKCAEAYQWVLNGGRVPESVHTY